MGGAPPVTGRNAEVSLQDFPGQGDFVKFFTSPLRQPRHKAQNHEPENSDWNPVGTCCACP